MLYYILDVKKKEKKQFQKRFVTAPTIFESVIIIMVVNPAF